jgi:hypothetical protein
MTAAAPPAFNRRNCSHFAQSVGCGDEMHSSSLVGYRTDTPKRVVDIVRVSYGAITSDRPVGFQTHRAFACPLDARYLSSPSAKFGGVIIFPNIPERIQWSRVMCGKVHMGE